MFHRHKVLTVCYLLAHCRYPEFAPMFRAELWNPDEWASLFKAAGAKCESFRLPFCAPWVWLCCTFEIPS